MHTLLGDRPDSDIKPLGKKIEPKPVEQPKPANPWVKSGTPRYSRNTQTGECRRDVLPSMCVGAIDRDHYVACLDRDRYTDCIASLDALGA